MNDLSKKEERHIEEKVTSVANVLLQKKLETYLLLLYQGYLKAETALAPEIRAAFLNLVKQDEALALKVRMLQLDYLHLEDVVLEGAWDTANEKLFPRQDLETLKEISDAREKTLASYREEILQLLRS